MPPGDTGHRMTVCRHGRVVTNCRCIGSKTETVVDCLPACLAKYGEVLKAADGYVGTHRAEVTS